MTRAQKAFRKGCAKRRFWLWQIFSEREELGEYHHLIKELKLPTGALKNIFLGNELEFNCYWKELF